MANESKSALEIRAELEAKRSATKAFYDSKKTDDGQYKMTVEERDGYLADLQELSSLQDAHAKAIEIEQLSKSADAYERTMNRVANPDVPPSDNVSTTATVKTIEQIISESAAYKTGIANGLHKQGMISINVPEYKATMTAAAGFAPEVTRNGVVVPYATFAPSIEDVIPGYSTTDSAVKYMEETTFTNGGVATAEDVAFTESALAYTERTASIEGIGSFIPVTEQQVEDVPALVALLESRLAHMNKLKRAHYIFNGTGTSPQISGFLDQAIQSQAKGVDSVPDAVHKAITKVAVTGGANASAVCLNPNDWQLVRLLQTIDGVYLYGSPSDVAMPRMWGLPVVMANDLSAGTGLVGDFQMFSQIANRKGITVEIGRNGDDFKTGRFTARVWSRFGLVVYRPYAFCSVTGIA